MKKYNRVPPPTGKLKKLMRSLHRLLWKFNLVRHNGNRGVSHKTRINRKAVLEHDLRYLFEGGYRITNVEQFRTKHILFLVDHWMEEGLTPGTIQNKLSIFGAFCHWIQKPNVIYEARQYIASKPDYQENVKREYSAKTDTGWPAAHDFEAILLKIKEDDPYAAIQVALQAVFGLRPKEAGLLQPHLADLGVKLHIERGSKNGRPRRVPISSEVQRVVLDKAKSMAIHQTDSLIPKKYSYKSWQGHYYYICRKHGMTKAKGTHPYALRHSYAQALYHVLSGNLAPVKRIANPLVPGCSGPMTDKEARQQVAEDLGHSRIQITSCYLGSNRLLRKEQDAMDPEPNQDRE